MTNYKNWDHANFCRNYLRCISPENYNYIPADSQTPTHFPPEQELVLFLEPIQVSPSDLLWTVEILTKATKVKTDSILKLMVHIMNWQLFSDLQKYLKEKKIFN